MTDIVEDLERWSLHPGEMCPACHAIDTPEPGCVCDVAPRAKAEIERLRAALDEINMASFPLTGSIWCAPIGAWDNAMRALETNDD